MNGTYTVNQFLYDPIRHTYISDMSDLGWRAGQRDFKQIYTDSCDEGLTLITRDGKADFVIVEETNEVTTLAPVKGKRGADVTPNTRILLFND